MIQCVTLAIPKRTKKNAVSISIAFPLDFLIRNENITFEECKTIGRVTNLQSWQGSQKYNIHLLGV